jgi:hypothetical protein
MPTLLTSSSTVPGGLRTPRSKLGRPGRGRRRSKKLGGDGRPRIDHDVGEDQPGTVRVGQPRDGGAEAVGRAGDQDGAGAHSGNARTARASILSLGLRTSAASLCC